MSMLSEVLKHVPGGNVLNAIGGVVDPVARTAIGAIPGGGAILSAGDAVGRLIPSGGSASGGGIAGALGGLGKDAVGLLTGNHGLNALGAAGAVNAALLQNKANDYAKNALGMETQAYNERAPLRTGGLQAMQSAMAANPYSGTALPARQPSALGVSPGIRPVTLGGGY